MYTHTNKKAATFIELIKSHGSPKSPIQTHSSLNTPFPSQHLANLYMILIDVPICKVLQSLN